MSTGALRGAHRLCGVVEQSLESTARSTGTGGHSRQERAVVACGIVNKSGGVSSNLVDKDAAATAVHPRRPNHHTTSDWGWNTQFNSDRGSSVMSQRMTVTSGPPPVGRSAVGSGIDAIGWRLSSGSWGAPDIRVAPPWDRKAEGILGLRRVGLWERDAGSIAGGRDPNEPPTALYKVDWFGHYYRILRSASPRSTVGRPRGGPGRRNGSGQSSASRAGKPPRLIGPHWTGANRMSTLPWSTMAWRYWSQSGCSPLTDRK
jgi:hypothetical protein